jgi:hypothetical protein
VQPETAPRRESDRRASGAAADDDQDVFLDVPHLHVESLDLEVADLRARVSLQAEVLNLLRLNIGVDAVLGQVRLNLSNVEAQAVLKVRLDKVAEIVNRVLATIDSNPEIIEPLTRANMATLEQTATGVGPTVQEAGERADQALQRSVQELDQLSRGVPQQGQGEEPSSIEASAIVEAETRQAEAEAEAKAREAEAKAREAGTAGRPGEGVGRQRLPGEPRQYRGLPRRAERR